MKRWTCLSAVFAVAVMLWSGTATGKDKPADCGKAGAPEKVEGQVVKVDVDRGILGVRESDGKTHEFHAGKETIQEYKVGDQIKAKLRSAPDCPK